MDIALELERFDHEWKKGDRALAKELAKEWVAAHPAIEQTLGQYTIEDLVRFVDRYREAGEESDRIITDMYLLAKFPPQRIVGSFAIGGAFDQVAAQAWGKAQ